MLSKIEALNYRCLRYVSQPLEAFHVLVGPNASGKTTFFEVVAFLSDLLSDGIDSAVRQVTPDPMDLMFARCGEKFELAVEAQVPQEIDGNWSDQRSIRYEVAIGIDAKTSEPSIISESVQFVSGSSGIAPLQKSLFPDVVTPPESLCQGKRRRSTKSIVRKNADSGKDNFYPEKKESGKGGGWVPSFQLGAKRSAFANLPEDSTRFPAATWFKEYLIDGIQNLVLDSQNMRLASPPGQSDRFATDGSNLPYVIERLRTKAPDNFSAWIAHLQTALPDIVDVHTLERPDTRFRHLEVTYDEGIRVPSWTVSDGTLRLMALTLPAFLPDVEGVFLIEEPENGIHPRAVETMFQAMSNVCDAQILVASHSPVILSIAEPSQILCFAKDSQGATSIVRGDQHPALVDWQHDISLGVLFASGVLG